MNKRFNKVFLSLLLLVISNAYAYGQASKSISLELGGASTVFGFHYDARFSAYTNWGYRVGLSFLRSKNDDYFGVVTRGINGYTIPFAVNYLTGKGKHHFEVGTGFDIGLYRCHFLDWQDNEVKETRVGSFVFEDLGYRYQDSKGLLLRAGLNISIPFVAQIAGTNILYAARKTSFVYPYIGVGYAF